MTATSYSLATHVLPVIPATFEDSVNIEYPFLNKLLKKDEKQDGGLNYSPNRVATRDTGGGWFAGTATTAAVTASQVRNLLNSTFDWKHVINDMLLTYDQQVRAGSSPYTKVEAANESRYSAKMHHMKLLSDAVINGDGTSNAPYGLVKFLTPAGVWGGVDPANDADFDTHATTSATVLSGPSVIETMIDNSNWMGNQPTDGPTTRPIFSKCKQIFQSGLTIIKKDGEDVTMGIPGINVLAGKSGKPVPIYWDDTVASYSLLLPDLDHFGLKKHSQYFLHIQDLERPQSGLDVNVSKVGFVLSSCIVYGGPRRTSAGFIACLTV
jgi:hypothetical protein